MRRVLPVLIAALAITGCGGGTKRTTAARKVVTVTTPLSVQTCPPGESQMGCAMTPPKTPPTAAFGRPAGPLLPDVSNWQGNVDWAAVRAWERAHGWAQAGIFKMGEFVGDVFASRNARLLHALGMWSAGYWFVRNTGCTHESSQILAAARSFRIRVVVLDIEVPEAVGYGHCLAAPLRAAGFIVVIYSGTGTWPGGPNDGLPLWIASYGSSFGCLWTCHPVAWQFTDGHFGFPVFVPGIGEDDVSVDFGITKLGIAKPTSARCFGKVRPIADCRGRWVRARNASSRAARAEGRIVTSHLRRRRAFEGRVSYFSRRIAAS